MLVEDINAEMPASSLEPNVVATIRSSGLFAIISASMRRATVAASSIRVPRCNSNVTVNLAWSDCGIKSIPMSPLMAGISDTAKNITMAEIVITLCFKAIAKSLEYFSSSQSRPAITVRS